MKPKSELKFPLLALVIGGLGTIAACLGILAYSAPQTAKNMWPLLAHTTVADALIAMGAIFIVIEMVMILQWIRRKRESVAPIKEEPVVNRRDRT